MENRYTGPILLSTGQFRQLAASLTRPDKAYMARRDAVFARIDNEISLERNGTDIRVDIPELDLSFIDRQNLHKLEE